MYEFVRASKVCCDNNRVQVRLQTQQLELRHHLILNAELTSWVPCSRLAPEFPYPAAVDDAFETVLWAMKEGETVLNLDLSKAAIGGASAGANLAAAVTQRVSSREDVLCQVRFKIQLLVVPVVDNTSTVETSPSYREFEHTPALSAKKMLWYRSLYLPNVERRSESEASPLLFENFDKLPPAVILVGELDVVRHEGEEYGRKLREAGVMAKVEVMRGMPHPFLALDGVLDEGKRAVKIICDSLREATA